MAPYIHWFRRDLRLEDNPALTAAARDSGGAVVPLFVLDDALLRPQGRFTCPARVGFLLEALRALADALGALGSGLVIARGDPRCEVPRVAQACGAAGVSWNRDYSPYALARDAALAADLQAAGLAVQPVKDVAIWEPGEITTRTGTSYLVYTPYARQWHERTAATPPRLLPIPHLRLAADALPPSLALPTLRDLGMQTDQQALPGGAARGQHLLQAFTAGQDAPIASYHQQRDMLALPGTSQLSAHLRLGTISPRACVGAALAVAEQHPEAAAGAQRWLDAFAWRDFYMQVLANAPHVLRGAFKPQYDAIIWEGEEAHFAAWCAGETGYPIVDAAMQQLNRTAWMHNRARMIVASFLTRTLLLDWRRGERYFMQHLVDGDPAANNGGWQWAAGTGTDAQPYFRIFNPVTQGQKFDPAGDYVRHYLPALAAVPAAAIHAPWKLSAAMQRQFGVSIGRDYPAPLVDYALQRRRALEMYGRVRDRPTP